MIILGLWDGHDSGAALIVDDRIVAAVNEERLTRRKLEIRFPLRSIRACLDLAGIGPEHVDVVAASTADPAKALGRLFPSTKERYYAVRRRKAAPGVLATATQAAKRRITEWPPNAVSRAISRHVLRRELGALGCGRATLHLVDHHECHARTAAHCSGFDDCVVVTIDGLGDGLSSTVSDFTGGQLRRVAASRARDSLGVFFEHVTHLMNMRELEDEGKVMALADHVMPVPDDRNPLLQLFHVAEGRIRCRVPAHAMAGELRRIQWTCPNEEFAYLAQRTVERVAVDLVRSAVALTGRRRVALAGGVTSNVKANRAIRLLPEVESVYVFPHMGDGGLPVGAALAAVGAAGPVPIDPLALGPAFTQAEIDRAAKDAGVTLRTPVDLASEVAERLVRGEIVCWFQGAMEYGPRALGHRSVLARPDRLDIKNRLNLAMKRRVWYQPFCPTLLESEAPRLFADWTADAARNRHMTMAFLVAAEFRSAMAGATSVDGSCRPQFVADDSAEPIAEVLHAVKARLGVGAVINTSFNIHGEPLVCTPAEAISVFQRSGADALVIGGALVARLAPG